MQDQLSTVKLIPNPMDDTTRDSIYQPRIPWYKSKRIIIFLITFFTALLIGESYTFLRPAVYRSSATLLTVAKPDIDQTSGEADIQHVAIQRHILTGTPLLTETVTRMQHADTLQSAEPVTINDIRNMLAVTPIEETNLVELQAEGHNPNILPLLVNTWIEVYLDARAQEVKQAVDNTSAALTEEFQGLEEKIMTNRQQLETFREEYDIVSMEREENEVLSRLKGLNASINKANEAAVNAKARLEATNQAIAQGKPVVPDSEKSSLAGLEQRAQLLREKVTEINRQYTPDYIKLQPSLKVIPEQLKKLEKEIRVKLDYGKQFVLSDAEQQYASTIQAVNSIQLQLNNLKQEASEFSSRFAEHEALQKELAGLEEIYRQTKERLVQLEVKHQEKYPQVDVVEWAFLPQDPIRPLYLRDAGIALVVSLLLGLLAVWIYEYLTRQEKTASPITLSGVHVYRNPELQELENQAMPELQQQSAQALASPFPHELSKHEVTILLANADVKGKQLILLLLAGLSIDEAAILNKDNINVEDLELKVTGPNPRIIRLPHSVKALLLGSDEFPVWQTPSAAEDTDELAATITCIAIDSGLSQPEQIDVQALRHTYITYLIRQGLRLSELQRIVGPLSTSTLASYGQFSPPGPGLSLEEIELEHPACQGLKLATD